MIDRYTKTLLTLIAVTLIYIAAVVTPFPAVNAQQPTLRPGESSGPTQVVIVGWQPSPRDVIPVAIQQTQPLRIEGTVTTERSTSRTIADRVVIVGWEEAGRRETQAPIMRQLTESSRLPVALPPPPREPK